ncbi:MAG: hypothetical protein ABSG17_06470 [Spirochaetia bacterium]|jgi:hypothetical protein
MKLGKRESKKRLMYEIVQKRIIVPTSERYINDGIITLDRIREVRNLEPVFPNEQVSLKEIPLIEEWLGGLTSSFSDDSAIRVNVKDIKQQIQSISQAAVIDASNITPSIRRINERLNSLFDENEKKLNELRKLRIETQEDLWRLEGYQDSKKSVDYTVINIAVSVGLAFLILLGTILYDSYKDEVDSYVRQVLGNPQHQKMNQPSRAENPAPSR